jgi:hypothetical protein
MLVWAPAYVATYGWLNFLHLCDVAVILTCAGLWLGSPLLLSSQALSSLVVDLAWDLDLLWRAVSGHHLIGGTEYMWDARFPLWVRLLSLFHVAWPPLLVWALRRIGYDRRGLLLQSAIAVVLLLASRLVGPELNLNFAHRDPFFGRAWGPAPVHLAVILAPLIGGIYLGTHKALSRLMPTVRSAHAGKA